MVKKIGILYLCTGKYKIFWKEFFKSCEKYLLALEGYKKEYFVFTDASSIDYEDSKDVHRIYQKHLDWPYITLMRYKIFNMSKALYQNLDYLYFFNANMLCVAPILEEFLPDADRPLVFLIHPGFYNRPRNEFTYERNTESLASVKNEEGNYYFQGALNGGIRKRYLEMCKSLEENIAKDLKKGIIAIWHDESHLNRYAIDHPDLIKPLDPSFGYPEGWDLPFDKKIIIRDKNKFGGHDYLRNESSIFKRVVRKIFR